MRLKQYLIRFVIAGLMLCCMWLISLLPARALDIAALCMFGCCFLVMVAFSVFVLKKKYFVFLWMIFGCANITMAQDINACSAAFDVSVAEGRWCLYSNTVEQYGRDVCNYIQSFQPQNVQNQDQTYVLQSHVNMADRIVQAYNDLDKTRQRTVGNNCTFLTAADRKSGLNTRLSKLRQNSSAVCCAWALQTMNQIYSSQYAERQIQTVPMMLADEKNQCWPCDVVYLLIVLVNTMVYRVGPAMAAVGIFFLKWALIFWLVIKIGMLFINRGSDKKEYTATKFFQEFFVRIIFVMVAALALGESALQYENSSSSHFDLNPYREKTMLDSVYQEIVNPIFEFVSSVGVEMTQTLLEGKNSFYGDVSNAVSKRSNLRAYAVAMRRVNYCSAETSIGQNSIYQYLNKPIASNAPEAYSSLVINGDGLFIQNDLALNILCLTQLSFRGMSPFGAIGSIFVSHAIRNGYPAPIHIIPGRVPLMPQLFYGLFLNVICWLVGILVAFKLIDIMLRVGMVVILTPMFIALMPFPISRGYAMKGFQFFLSALMEFIEVSLAVGIVVPFFFKAIAGKDETTLIQLIVAPSNSRYVPNLYKFFTDHAGRILIYILGVAWLSKSLFSGVQNFFKKVFGVAAVGSMAGGGTLSAVQKGIRSTIGETYDFGKRAVRSAQPFKYGFEKRLDKTMAGRAIEGAGAAVGRRLGSVGGHTAVAKHRFYKSGVGRAAIATKNGTKKAYNATKNALNKTGNLLGTGVQRGGTSMIKAGANISKAGYGLGSIIGIPMMVAGSAVWAGGTTAKFAGQTIASTLRRAPSFAKKQFKKGVYQFFHPEEK